MSYKKLYNYNNYNSRKFKPNLTADIRSPATEYHIAENVPSCDKNYGVWACDPSQYNKFCPYNVSSSCGNGGCMCCMTDPNYGGPKYQWQPVQPEWVTSGPSGDQTDASCMPITLAQATRATPPYNGKKPFYLPHVIQTAVNDCDKKLCDGSPTSASQNDWCNSTASTFGIHHTFTCCPNDGGWMRYKYPGECS